VLRIAQEPLTNAARHAGAGHCRVRVAASGTQVTLVVDDDGRGVPPGAGRGVGIDSMRQRAQELGGSCTVGGAPDGTGTRVEARIPI
jgi:signal transduction histidine kinase